MKLFRYGLLYLLLVVFLAACGGGGGSAPAAIIPPPAMSAGVFLDSAVAGLTYQSGSNSPGTTDENGTFMYTPGETLTFSVGGVVIGTLPDGALVVTPLDFGAAAENIARFLQTLDEDGDPSNGIDITAAAAALAETTLGDAVFLSDPITFENDIGPVLEVALGPGAVLIDAATALANLEAALDSTFDVAELAGRGFAAEIALLSETGAVLDFDIGFLDFAPLVNPGDSGSTVISVFREDSFESGGDGSVDVDDWSVDADGVLALTDPITMETTLVEKTGGSARAISFVAMEDSPGSDTIVGTLLIPVTVTAAALAGESGRTYDVVANDSNNSVRITFFPDGTLRGTENGFPFSETWAILPNGVSIVIQDPFDPSEVDLLALLNGSYATGGDILTSTLNNLSGDPNAPVFLLESINMGTLTPTPVSTINFSGQLDIVQVDNGGAVYSGVPIGTVFSGAIDFSAADNGQNVDGFISDGTTLTSFTCCIFADGFDVANNEVLDADDAATINAIAGTSFVPGDILDFIGIDGDAFTSGGGRIEVGLSFVLEPDAFSENDCFDCFPPDPAKVIIEVFFIAEENDLGEDIYSAIGVLD